MAGDSEAGVRLGLACGDALGRPVEFKSASTIDREHGTLTEMIGHDLPGVVHDQEEIGELVTGAVVVQQRRHEERVVLQARVRVVYPLVEAAGHVRREPRMHRLGVRPRQQATDCLRETRARERRGVAVRAVRDGLVHRDAVEGVRRVVVRLAVQLVGIVAVGRDHHVLTAVAQEVAE
nr:ADP-ribosylglycohydrolase family protein [Halomicroarcula sp. SYNS111]